MGDGRKVVIIAGAGATRSDFEGVPKPQFLANTAQETPKPPLVRPPLNKGFFGDIRNRDNYPEIPGIEKYMRAHRASPIDIFSVGGDDLELVMSALHSDASDSNEEATVHFFSLLDALARRIAETTTSTNITERGNCGRIIGGYLGNGFAPGDITVITFNYDLQIEKAVSALQQNSDIALKYGTVFNFPYCYKIDSRRLKNASFADKNQRVFSKGNSGGDGISILKLHGSLNWFHKIPQKLDVQKCLPGPRTRIHTDDVVDIAVRESATGNLPTIIPPIGENKAPRWVFGEIWGEARNVVRGAKEIVIFGYSCPGYDRDGANLIGEIRGKKLSVIDTDINERHDRLLKKNEDGRVYASVDDFFGDRF